MNRIIEYFNTKNLRLLLMTAGVIIALFAFEEVVDDVFSDPMEGDYEAQVFDQTLSAWVNKIQTPSLTQVMIDITALGSVSVIVVLFCILASVLITFRDFKGLLYLSTVLIGAGIWPTVLKTYYQRSRPLDVNHLVNVLDLSFPSGHAFGATAIYISLSYYSGQYAKIWFQELFFYFLGAILITMVGISRIYLGVHYPTDVLAGISGGAAWGLAVSAMYEFIKMKLQNK